MSVKFSLLMIGLLGFGVLVTPPEANAQVPTRDTTQTLSGSEPAPADTNPASPGTAAAANDTGAVADTAARGDTTAASDTTETRDTVSTRDTTVASDTTPARDTAQARDTAAAAASVEPTDSILSAACAGGGTVARDLLVIVFAPGASDGERTAAAESVKGKLLGPVSASEPGAYYLRVPSGGGEFGLRATSDELIQLAQVRQVGSRACPPPPPPDKVQQKPS